MYKAAKTKLNLENLQKVFFFILNMYMKTNIHQKIINSWLLRRVIHISKRRKKNNNKIKKYDKSEKQKTNIALGRRFYHENLLNNKYLSFKYYIISLPSIEEDTFDFAIKCHWITLERTANLFAEIRHSFPIFCSI